MDKQPLSDLACLVPASRPIMVRQPLPRMLGRTLNASVWRLHLACADSEIALRICNVALQSRLQLEKKLLPNCRRGTSTPMQRCGWPSARTAWETRVIVGITCMPLHVGLYCTLCRWAGGKGDMLERVSSHTIPLPYCVPRRIRQLFELHPGGRTASPLACPWLCLQDPRASAGAVYAPDLCALGAKKACRKLLQPGG